jgi:hypothetical protein
MGNRQYTFTIAEHDKAKIELPTKLLEHLILSGLISGNECICLDEAARKTVWKSILQGSLNQRNNLWT